MQKRVICSWARTAKTDKERDIFLQMARAWLDAAARHEGVSNRPMLRVFPGAAIVPAQVSNLSAAIAPPHRHLDPHPGGYLCITGRMMP